MTANSRDSDFVQLIDILADLHGFCDFVGDDAHRCGLDSDHDGDHEISCPHEDHPEPTWTVIADLDSD